MNTITLYCIITAHQGKEIATLVSENQTPGSYIVDFNATQYTSGIYFYKITADNFSDVKKMVLVK